MRLLCTTLRAVTSLLLKGPIFDLAGDANAAASTASPPRLRSNRLSPFGPRNWRRTYTPPCGNDALHHTRRSPGLRQTTYTVVDNPNFTGPIQVGGVLLEELFRDLGANPDSDLIVAICGDQYRANYPYSYIAAHHSLLVLSVNGKPPSDWPKDAEGHGSDMGPYMISYSKFTSSFIILAHHDEPQIPWGVVRLEFRNAKTVFGAIAPHGPRAAEPQVQDGYRIAQQNCFRQHR